MPILRGELNINNLCVAGGGEERELVDRSFVLTKLSVKYQLYINGDVKMEYTFLQFGEMSGLKIQIWKSCTYCFY